MFNNTFFYFIKWDLKTYFNLINYSTLFI